MEVGDELLRVRSLSDDALLLGGQRCTWRAPDGTPCDSRAWLEHDPIVPRGQGEAHDVENGRILCRPHNRLAAEQAYGRQTIDRILTRQRQRKRRTPASPEAKPSKSTGPSDP